MSEQLLAELQATLDREIPICRQMGIRVNEHGVEGLKLSAPLALNHNHQQTAFAGTLNALCTLAGWGSVYLLTRAKAQSGNIVIRRSSIKYLRPVTAELIVAHCPPAEPESEAYFLEMLREKGQAKLDLRSEIVDSTGEVAVSFQGSYVVLE